MVLKYIIIENKRICNQGVLIYIGMLPVSR